jgi:hypothetical protein
MKRCITPEELIAKQQLEIENLKLLLKENSELISELSNSFYSVGAPLNDNVVKMNKEQMKWCFGVAELVQQINYL